MSTSQLNVFDGAPQSSGIIASVPVTKCGRYQFTIQSSDWAGAIVYLVYRPTPAHPWVSLGAGAHYVSSNSLFYEPVYASDVGIGLLGVPGQLTVKGRFEEHDEDIEGDSFSI